MRAVSSLEKAWSISRLQAANWSHSGIKASGQSVSATIFLLLRTARSAFSSASLAERLRAANVDVTYQLYRDLWHAGQIVAAIHPPAAAALAECGRYVQAVLAASPQPEAA